MPHDPAADLALLIEVAEAAAPMAMSRFKTEIETWEKPGLGPVTEADLAIDVMARERLQGARPDYGWLSEESLGETDRAERVRVFIIDPIDGTRAFMAGEQGWGTAIAVAERGQVTAAVMHLPARNETYSALRGQGAWLNGERIATSGRSALDGATALATKKQLAPELWPGGALPVERHYRTSLAWRMCLVARGRFDMMVTLRPAYEWDVAAGTLIAKEAGATVTDSDGATLRFNRHPERSQGVIVAPAPLHAQVMSRRASPAD